MLASTSRLSPSVPMVMACTRVPLGGAAQDSTPSAEMMIAGCGQHEFRQPAPLLRQRRWWRCVGSGHAFYCGLRTIGRMGREMTTCHGAAQRRRAIRWSSGPRHPHDHLHPRRHRLHHQAVHIHRRWLL
ncbi:hypothetical protein J8273_2203 [Carpediemonas membranifera]|uniref:Uncharacterized protein n=1 Tax=Carpediemonas membranifera TaxID=201153 RepID=A0A8J6AZ41_9EUKA|nr:hypothetical protein J8273_2203 [Carpediemonas membranifera]|eukprot:KAG9395870.1 hypothetical protein J8273_2203 [Carpediemonas membranifera]